MAVTAKRRGRANALDLRTTHSLTVRLRARSTKADQTVDIKLSHHTRVSYAATKGDRCAVVAMSLHLIFA